MAEEQRDYWKELKELQAKVKDGDLDEAIHEAFSNMASAVNNGGVNDQVNELVRQYGVGEAIQIIKDHLS